MSCFLLCGHARDIELRVVKKFMQHVIKNNQKIFNDMYIDIPHASTCDLWTSGWRTCLYDESGVFRTCRITHVIIGHKEKISVSITKGDTEKTRRFWRCACWYVMDVCRSVKTRKLRQGKNFADYGCRQRQCVGVHEKLLLVYVDMSVDHKKEQRAILTKKVRRVK